PTLDGSLDDPCWQDLPEATCFYDADYGVPRKAASRTALKAGYDTNGLYFGVRCEDDHPEAIKAAATRPNDEDLWKDDCLEFYFAGAPSPGVVRQFALNTLGTQGRHDRLEDGRLVSGDPSGWQVAVASDDRGWTAELFIPFAELDAAATGQRNDLCRFAVRRFVYSGRDLSAVSAYGAVSPYGAGFGRPEALGWLLFSEAGGRPDVDWMCGQVSGRVPGDWILPIGQGECAWKQGDALRKLSLDAAVEELEGGLTAEAATLRGRGSQYGPAADLAEARLAALPRLADGAPLARVLSDLSVIESTLANKYLAAEHGTICRMPGRRFGFFGWPSVAR
ncbi:MAG: hypothetical protein KAT39_15550, partial [Alphaproteobacteria bacterium]|nr:hypothetical protein [Alphaproteobacteria bacterium]